MVRRRAAFTVTECLVALVLLGAAAALMAQLVSAVGVQRRVADQHALALQETANLVERLFALPYAELTTQRAAELQLSEAARQQLPDARLQITIHSTAGQPAAKEIRISLQWLDRSGRHGAPAELTAWRHDDGRNGS
jgi:Tfp pilus assembly protein PilE